MRCLLVPATTTDRDIARLLWSRMDQILGYPRTHSADEADVTIAIGTDPPRTETLFLAFVHDATGATQLHGVVALVIEDPPDGMLRRRITWSGTTRTLGQWIAWLQTNRGWQLASALPGVESAWSLVAVRDGAAGSSDGVPIPEGSE